MIIIINQYPVVDNEKKWFPNKNEILSSTINFKIEENNEYPLSIFQLQEIPAPSYFPPPFQIQKSKITQKKGNFSTLSYIMLEVCLVIVYVT